ncbi:hypothetical protein CCO03_16975 [Comamonas serinivorans]|uniref:Uncharacterized protein n=1 Tax=Comamonas serinivorans TaxID=1082851 RepID=A0A1Y0ES52_9BURK|nr:DUF6682 family protein [Comamonas serinivorans]ARU06139.1 hypothetical protein CCO03_16975 [Comamonas serinivorans]
MIDGTELLAKLRIELQDPDGTRWPDAADCLNRAAAEITVHRSDLFSSTVTHALIAGARQTLPDSAFRLVEVICNEDGAPVTLCESRREMDMAAPGWMKSAPRAQVRQYMYDLREPAVFYVYPPAQGGIKLDMIVTRRPALLAADGTGAIDIDPIFEGALLKGGVWQAMSRDAEYAENAAVVNAAYAAFAATLTGDIRTSLLQSPKARGTADKAEIRANA